MPQYMFAGRSFRAEPNKIHDLEDAERVDDKKRDKPRPLAAARGVPEGEPFQYDGPKHGDKDQRNKNTHELRRERGVERCVWLHMSGLYHTLVACDISVLTMGARESASPFRTKRGRWGFRTRS